MKKKTSKLSWNYSRKFHLHDRKAKSEMDSLLNVVKSINDLNSKIPKKRYTKEGDIENIFRQIKSPHRAIYKAYGETFLRKCKYKYCQNKTRKGDYFCSNDCAILKLSLIITGNYK